MMIIIIWKSPALTGQLPMSMNASCTTPLGAMCNLICVHSKQGVFKEGPPTGGGANPAAPTVGGADPATSTNSTGAKGKLPRTPVRHALYNVPDVP